MSKLYFRYPVFIDYTIAAIVCLFFSVLNERDILLIKKDSDYGAITTDLSTIALTLAGFVLTLLTVLITFKTGARIPNEDNREEVPLFDFFFSSKLYFDTINLLKNCIKSLIFIAILGFTLKLLLSAEYLHLLFYSNILGLTIIVTTLLRSLAILTSIVNLQKH